GGPRVTANHFFNCVVTWRLPSKSAHRAVCGDRVVLRRGPDWNQASFPQPRMPQTAYTGRFCRSECGGPPWKHTLSNWRANSHCRKGMEDSICTLAPYETMRS